METPAPAPVLRAPDVIVRAHRMIVKFEPQNLKAEAWLARNVGREHHADGHVVLGPLKAAYISLSMAQDGLVVG